MSSSNNILYNINVKRGHQWPGVTFEIIKNGEPWDITGADITMWVVNSLGDTTPLLELDIESGDITIVDGPAGQFSILSRVWDLAPGKYPYDIKIELDDEPFTDYVQGFVIIRPRATV